MVFVYLHYPFISWFLALKYNYFFIFKGSGSDFMTLWVYVDGIIIYEASSYTIAQLKFLLNKISFKLRDLGNLKYFLSLELSRFSKEYICRKVIILCNFLKMLDYLDLPMDSHLKLLQTGGELLDTLHLKGD